MAHSLRCKASYKLSDQCVKVSSFVHPGGGKNRSEDEWTASACVPWEQVTQIRFKRINKWGGGAGTAEIAARRMLPLVIVKLNTVTVCSHGQKYPGFIKKRPLQLQPGLRCCRSEPYSSQTFLKNDSVGGTGILYCTCINTNAHEGVQRLWCEGAERHEVGTRSYTILSAARYFETSYLYSELREKDWLYKQEVYDSHMLNLLPLTKKTKIC